MSRTKRWKEARDPLLGTYEAQGFCTVCWEHWLWPKRPLGMLICPKCDSPLAGEREESVRIQDALRSGT